METMRLEKKTLKNELEREQTCRLHLRSRFGLQQKLLQEALVLLQGSRKEMAAMKKQFTHILETWENSKALIQESCISVDAECADLKQEVKDLHLELKRFEQEVPNLRSCLDEANNQILQMENEARKHTLLQNKNQEAQALIQGLVEEVKTHANEEKRIKKLLEMKSAEREDLQVLWREQTTTIERLSQELREKEESFLSLNEELLGWKQKEEEANFRLEKAQIEAKELKAVRCKLQQESVELQRIHMEELERLEESFKIRLKVAEEHNSKMEAFLQNKQAEQDKQLKELEVELRREAEIELDIQRQKNLELLSKYQTETQQLQNKIPSLIDSATQLLHEELVKLQHRVEEQQEEMQCFCDSATQRQQELLQERRTGEEQLQTIQLDLWQKIQEMNEAQSHIQQLREEKVILEEEKLFLEETVRRECEEREELTATLVQLKQLMAIKQPFRKPQEFHPHTQLFKPQMDLSNKHLTSLPSCPQIPKHSTSPTLCSRQRWTFLSSEAVGGSRLPSTLPTISRDRSSSVKNGASDRSGPEKL
ncbi:hypothetical protein DNTS_011415 [Danionella cerebrum]|uniref:Uncharacterized protein n=1 Tax=Danionella cerebrum TaxID=2873325 RepID=A0A553PW03_9TELE|nr:hypothetical protein DNTS_011415 [Danionella translucida]